MLTTVETAASWAGVDPSRPGLGGVIVLEVGAAIFAEDLAVAAETEAAACAIPTGEGPGIL